jgi:hypothetical protein
VRRPASPSRAIQTPRVRTVKSTPSGTLPVCARIDHLVLLVLSDSPQQIANQNDAHFEPRSLRTVTKTFLATLSNNILIGKQGSETFFSDWSFGGINVVLCGDLHQFPPVAKNRQEFLFTPTKAKDSQQCQLGRTQYEEFKTVVVLKEQKRITDPVWHEMLTNLRNGQMQKEDVEMLRELIVGGSLNDKFDVEPWSNACLVTPRHAVHIVWNKLCARKWCRKSGRQLFICPAQDTVEDCPLTLSQRISVARFSPEKKNRGTLLADEVELAKGLKVMVTNNLATDLDITNRARGEIVDIIFDKDEPDFPDSLIVRLHKMPRCVLVKLARTRASQLDGLDEGVIPVEPMTCKMKIPMADTTGQTRERLVIRRQFPITSAYAFTDYRSQGQTICPVMVDPATPPSGGLSLFNIYVALSRSTGRSTIHLLRDFNDQLFQKPLDTDLMLEDEQLERLNQGT